MKHPMAKSGTRRSMHLTRAGVTALLTMAPPACVGAPPDEATETSRAAVTTSTTPSPVTLHRGVGAATADDFESLSQGLDDTGWVPASVSAHRGPDGAARYSGAWQKNAAVLDAASSRGLDAAALGALHGQRVAAGMRMVDLDAESDGASVRYAAVWWRGGGAPPTVLSPSMTRSQLDVSLAGAAAQGVRAVRISPFRVGAEARYAVLWATDGAGGEALVDRPLADIAAAFSAQAAAGRSLYDLSALPADGELRWTATFVPLPGVRSRQYRTRMTPAEFVDAERAAQREGMVLVDVDTAHDPATGDPRLAAVWHRRAARGETSWSATVDAFRLSTQQLVAANLAANPGARVGFLVEDLQRDRYLGVEVDMPFYLASTTKVFLGAAAVHQLGVSNWDVTGATLYTARWRGDNRAAPGFTVADVGNFFTMRRWLQAMLVVSDTNATDFFADTMDAQHGARSMDFYLQDAGLSQIGEVTSICEVDRRVFGPDSPNGCLRQVPCAVMEHYWRGGNAGWPAGLAPSASDAACLTATPFSENDAVYARYFETLANTTTPREYARFLRAVAGNGLMSAGSRGPLLATMAMNRGGFTGAALARMGVGAVGTKPGDRYDTHSRTGLMWDYLTAPADPTRVRPRYSFQVFSEGESGASFSALYPALVENAVRYLQTD